MNINVNSTQADSALALLPMYVPGALTSVQPAGVAHLGVPLAIYPAPTGLAMVIDPVTTLSTTLAAFDTVVAWLNGQPTSAIKIIQPGEENDRILLYLPPGLLVNGINTLFYRVTRTSGNFEDSTPILNVLFNNPAPNITVSHPASIGPGQPAVITLTVGYARPYDTVTLTIGTWSITFNNPDPAKPITHTLSAAELQQIGDGTHPVSARVIDQLTNTGVSATTFLDIGATRPVLTIDTSPMTLNKTTFWNTYGWRYNALNESSETRKATGGVLPYIYISSDPNIATVDGNGKVIASRNGTAIITVTDAVGSTVFYTVRVSNVYQTVVNNGMLTADEARTWTISVGGNVDNIVETAQFSHLENYGRDVFDDRIYPDPLCQRFCQIQTLGMSLRVWAGPGQPLGGGYWPWGSPQRMRVITSVPS